MSIFGISALLRTKISHSRFFGLVRGIVGQDSSVEAGIGTSNTVRKKNDYRRKRLRTLHRGEIRIPQARP